MAPTTTKQQLHEKANRYRNDLDKGLLMKSVGYFSHADIHMNVSDKNLMERLLTDVTENSTFETPEIADEYIHESMFSKMDNIVEWLDNASFGERKAFDACFGDETLGHGFVMNRNNRTIREYTTNTVRMVLKHDRTNQYGFSLVTAYPCMMTSDVQPTNRDLTPVIQQTDVYKNASPVKKAYLEYRGDPKYDALVTYKQGDFPANDHITVHIPTNQPNIKHMVRLKENGSTIMTTHDKEPTTSEFTSLRDILHPNQKGKLIVYFDDIQLQNLLAENHPKHAVVVDSISKSIKRNLSSPSDPTKGMTVTEKHSSRVAQAQRVFDNITYDTESSSEYQKP